MYKIKTYNKISDVGRNAFSSDYEIDDNFKDYDAIIVHSTPLHNEVFSKDLKAIVRVGAGVNTIPVDECTKNGIAVFNTPGGNSNAVKELVLSAMIIIIRNVLKANSWIQSLNNGDEEPGKVVEKGKEVYRGIELMGKTIGIIGVGAVGSKVAKSCYDLSMNVIGYDPFLHDQRKEELHSFVKFVDDVNELYKNSDFVSIHIPYNKENEKFLDENAIKIMKDGVYIINYARMGVVDNDAIVSYLKNNKIKAYATDFPTKEELKMETVFSTPHLGAGTIEADENCAIMASRQIKDYLENGNISNSVNLPNLSFNRAFGDRICILHKNKVGMLGKITEIISNLSLNIENLANKARGEIAYTILDFNVSIDENIIDKLLTIGDIISIRIIK